MHLHHAPFTFSSSYIFYHPSPICVMYTDRSWLFDLLYRYYYIYQCLGLVLWSTEVLTEGLPLLFGTPFSIVIFLALLFSLCGTFSANKHMDGWMDGTSHSGTTALLRGLPKTWQYRRDRKVTSGTGRQTFGKNFVTLCAVACFLRTAISRAGFVPYRPQTISATTTSATWKDYSISATMNNHIGHSKSGFTDISLTNSLTRQLADKPTRWQ